MQGKNSYRVSLGPFELVSLGLGGTIGSGIFVVPGIAAGIAGPYWHGFLLRFQQHALCIHLPRPRTNIRQLVLFIQYFQMCLD